MSVSSEATATTPLLSPPRPPGTATATNNKGDTAAPPSPPPPWTHDLGRQLRLQLLLSGLAFLLALFVVLAAALLGLPADDDDDGVGGNRRETGVWAIASLALGGVGMVLDAAGLVAVLRQGRRLRSPAGLGESVAAPDADDGDSSSGSGPSPSLLLPLTLQLLFNAGAFTPCRIVGTVLSFTGSPSSSSSSSSTGRLALDAALTGAMALASLGQLLVSVYFFKCLRFHRAFEEAVGRLRRQGKGGGGGGGGAEAGAARLPSEALIDVFRTLGQRPTATELAELAARDSASRRAGGGGSGGGGLVGGGSFVDFADFCRLQAHYDRVVGARKRRRLRERARRMSLEEGALEKAGVAAAAKGAADKAVLTTSTATGAAAASGGLGASGV